MISDVKLNREVGRLLESLYKKRFANLEKLALTDLLNKNPYLYRALGESDPSTLLNQILLARISSSDETIFGNDFFEPLAVFAAKEAGGKRHVTVSAGAGQDIAIETTSQYLAISVKSGTNIFNSQSEKGQSIEFSQLQARMRKLGKMFRPIVGYGYGRKAASKKATTVERLAGQAFWELLTGEANFYLRISQVMASFAKDHGALYGAALSRKHLALVREFMLNFVTAEGELNWDSLVEFNSSQKKPERLKTSP